MTIAQQIKWDFKTNGDLDILDKNGKIIYFEYSNGYWEKCEWDSQGKQIYHESSNGFWAKYEYDSQGNEIYCENSGGYWGKSEWDSQGNTIYYENSDGVIKDNRPKSCEGKIVEFEGEKYKLTKV
jgi:hypothetical protein